MILRFISDKKQIEVRLDQQSNAFLFYSIKERNPIGDGMRNKWILFRVRQEGSMSMLCCPCVELNRFEYEW